jgi:Protein of unknown function (DUF1698)
VFHSYDLGDGVTVQGHKTLDQLRWEWDRLKLSDLTGKTVLDVNTWDGWFTLQAEGRGAKRVVGLDWYMWSVDQPEHVEYCLQHKAAGTIPKPYHEMPYFRPTELPGKIGFDTARRLNSSRVEEVANWWSPNARALRQMLLAVGFEAAEITIGLPPQAAPAISKRDALRALLPTPLRKLVMASPVLSPIRRYRAYAHARRSAEKTTRPSPVPLA